jgi:hypothetical protein
MRGLYQISAVVLVIILFSAFETIRPTKSSEFLEIKCSGSGSLDVLGKCNQTEDKVGGLIKVTVNQYSGTVLLDVLENNGQFFRSWIFLENCKVVTFDDWKCGETSSQSEYGVFHGRYYRTVQSFGAPSSSIKSWSAWAYRHRLISLATAIEYDWL